MLTTEKKKYTEQDYMMLEEGAPFQLINYDLIMSPAATPQHQLISGEIYSAILDFLKETKNKGAVIYSPVDVAFNEGNIYQPDLIFISADRKAELIKKRIEGAPDMVVEILSPSNAYYDLRQKKDIYEKYGVKEYLIVDPVQETIEIHFLENGVYKMKGKANKTEQLASIILPGLKFDLAKIFA